MDIDLSKLRPATLAGIVVDLREAITEQEREGNILQEADQLEQLEASFDALVDNCGLSSASDYIDKVKKSN